MIFNRRDIGMLSKICFQKGEETEMFLKEEKSTFFKGRGGMFSKWEDIQVEYFF